MTTLYRFIIKSIEAIPPESEVWEDGSIDRLIVEMECIRNRKMKGIWLTVDHVDINC